MALQGCYACIKYLVIIFNFLFWLGILLLSMGYSFLETLHTEVEDAKDRSVLAPSLLFIVLWTLAGIGVLALSIYTYVKASNYTAGSEEIKTLFISLYILMAAGSLMTILGFLGCCGALRESQCMLGSFFFLVLIILIAEIVAGVWAAMNQKEVEKIITKELQRTIQKEYGANEVANRTIDAIQHDFACCGAKGPSDWKESNFNKQGTGEGSIADIVVNNPLSFRVPASCCKDSSSDCYKTFLNDLSAVNSIYMDGCVKKLEDAIKSNLTIVAGVGIGLGVIQILGLIFSIILCCAIRNGEGVSYHV